MISRRLAVGGSALAWLWTGRTATPAPAGDRLAFRIVRKGNVVGEHILAFTRAGEALTVAVATDMVVSDGPIAMSRYKQRATILSTGNQIVSIDSETNDDGVPRKMTARRDDSGLVIEGSKAPRYVAPPRAQAGTFWNRAMLEAPFINIEDGRLMRPTITLIGTEHIEVAGGTVEARHFALRGDANLDTYYDLTSHWAGLRFAGKDGSEIRYVRN
jgi:hypothetical protein